MGGDELDGRGVERVRGAGEGGWEGEGGIIVDEDREGKGGRGWWRL